jgi:glutamate-1-semialdehyde 2,1-aminomutase
MNRRYQTSGTMLTRAEKVIPLGSQTFSKSKVQFPIGAAPLFIERGRGCRVWDPDGNEYVDFISSLAAMTLGHCDPDVDAAVRAQLDDGILFSLPHRLETEVAERIVDMVPSADMVRFGKNGSDATAGAVRVARAVTGRDRVAVCGYHGWQDWYIGTTTRNKGVPGATRDLSHIFRYNDLDSLLQVLSAHPGEFAAVILEPMGVFYPDKGFLEGVRDLAHKNGALLIFDEVITGFRLAPGGAQELFGVTPDLCSLGKGMANGFPISAVAGKAEYMRQMEEIFFSFTMGGEALSLAAARATLDKLRRENVIPGLYAKGEKIVAIVRARIDKFALFDAVELIGHPTWTVLNFKGTAEIPGLELKTLFMQECIARGILTFGTHTLNHAHGEAEITLLTSVYDEVFPILRSALDARSCAGLLTCEPLRPLFSVR